MRFEEIIENKEYRERVIKFFNIQIKLSASKEKLLSDLEFLKHTDPIKYKQIIEFTEADFKSASNDQNTETPDFSMEDVLIPLIKDLRETEGWKEFEKQDYSKVLDGYEGAVNVHQFYKKENDGKNFLSIDLEAANWQSIQMITGIKESYQELIEKYTSRLIPKVSKTIRTKISGMLDPSIAHYNKKILVENKSKILNYLYEYADIDLREVNPTAFYADEFVTELSEEQLARLESMDLKELESKLYECIGVKLHVRPFTLKSLNLNKGYVKFTKEGYEIIGLNKDVLLIVNKLLHGYPVKQIDFDSIKMKQETNDEFLSRVEESISKVGLFPSKV